MSLAETKEEKQIIKAIGGGIAIAKFTAHDEEAFLDFLGEWKVMIGDQRKSTGRGAVIDLVMIKEFIKESFPTITLPEIKLAAKLSILGKLSCSPQLYNNQSFSILYCTTVISSYLDYKKEQLAPVFDKWVRTPPPDKEWTDQEKLDSCKDLFAFEYEKYKKTGEIEDPMNLCYNFLIKSKRLVLYTDQVTAAQKYGKEQAIRFLQKEDGSVKEALSRQTRADKTLRGEIINVTQLEKQYARNYCVQQFFNALANIEQLTDTILLSEFEQPKAIKDKPDGK